MAKCVDCGRHLSTKGGNRCSECMVRCQTARDRGYQLLTQELRKRFPPLYATEEEDDPIVQVKLFTPDSSWTWYATEFDGEDIFFGFVIGHYPEYGYFSLKEMESVRGPLGLPIERDLGFEPCRLSEARRREGRHTDGF